MGTPELEPGVCAPGDDVRGLVWGHSVWEGVPVDLLASWPLGVVLSSVGARVSGSPREWGSSPRKTSLLLWGW